jgi:hypothetical protein
MTIIKMTREEMDELPKNELKYIAENFGPGNIFIDYSDTKNEKIYIIPDIIDYERNKIMLEAKKDILGITSLQKKLTNMYLWIALLGLSAGVHIITHLIK